MSLQGLLDRAGNKIELPYLGLSFRKFGYQVFHDGEFASVDEFCKKLESLYGRIRGLSKYTGLEESNGTMGLCAAVKEGLPSKVNIHIVMFPYKGIPAELRGQFRINTLGHEETHALFIMGESHRLATKMDDFIKTSNSTVRDLICRFLSLPDGEEYVCDVGGFYAVARSMDLSPDALKRGLIRYYSSLSERIKKPKVNRIDLTLEVLAEMGIK